MEIDIGALLREGMNFRATNAAFILESPSEKHPEGLHSFLKLSLMMQGGEKSERHDCQAFPVIDNCS
jgi:hypothetical protein